MMINYSINFTRLSKNCTHAPGFLCMFELDVLSTVGKVMPHLTCLREIFLISFIEPHIKCKKEKKNHSKFVNNNIKYLYIRSLKPLVKYNLFKKFY